jgi:hypothetical protein
MIERTLIEARRNAERLSPLSLREATKHLGGSRLVL